MTQNHEHEDNCERGPRGGGESGEPGSGSGPDTRFLDFEVDKVMYSEAEALVREAYRELIKDAIKQRLQSRWGARITALAHLAADELIADTEANLEIQARIEARNAARRSLEDRIQAIIRDEGPTEVGSPEPGPRE